MAMWYFEEFRVDRWHPRTSWTRPTPHPDPAQRLPQRGLVRVRPSDEDRPLEELTAIYGCDVAET